MKPSLELASHGYYVSVTLRWAQGAEGVGFAEFAGKSGRRSGPVASGDMEGYLGSKDTEIVNV